MSLTLSEREEVRTKNRKAACAEGHRRKKERRIAMIKGADLLTREEVANMLGLKGIRWVNALIHAGKLQVETLAAGVSGIPRASAEAYYAKSTSGPAAPVQRKAIQPAALSHHVLENMVLTDRDALTALIARVDMLERQFGFGAPRQPLSDREIQELNAHVLDALTRTSAAWSIQIIHNFADSAASLRHEDIERIIRITGSSSLFVQFTDLIQRMDRVVTTRRTYPTGGLDILHARLEQARNHLLGLIGYDAHVRPKPPDAAARLLRNAPIAPMAQRLATLLLRRSHRSPELQVPADPPEDSLP